MFQLIFLDYLLANASALASQYGTKVPKIFFFTALDSPHQEDFKTEKILKFGQGLI